LNTNELAVARKTHVEIHILGTAALIEQTDPNDPMAAVLPDVPATLPMDAHVPYVAWSPSDEAAAPAGTTDPALKRDPLEKSDWRVHRLVQEELIVGNDVSGNPPLKLPTSGEPCSPDFVHGGANLGCIAPVSDFVSAPQAYIADYVNRVTADPKIRGRLEIRNGVLKPQVLDKCEWEIKKASGPATRRHLASDIIYQFDIPEKMLTLKLRKLNESNLTVTTDLVTLKADELGTIVIRFGNAVDIFPDASHLVSVGKPDPHFDVYYDFLDGVPSHDRVLPVRTQDCDGHPFDPTVYCGPGWIKGVGVPKPKKP
jgi:hypothetical protein